MILCNQNFLHHPSILRHHKELFLYAFQRSHNGLNPPLDNPHKFSLPAGTAVPLFCALRQERNFHRIPVSRIPQVFLPDKKFFSALLRGENAKAAGRYFQRTNYKLRLVQMAVFFPADSQYLFFILQGSKRLFEALFILVVPDPHTAE